VPTLENLTSKDIATAFSHSSLTKARGYVGRAGSLVRRGNRLSAKVMGTRMYDVEIEVVEAGILAKCSCPVGGSCKHIGAVLLRWVESPRSFRVEETEPAAVVAQLEIIPAENQPPAPPKGQPEWQAKSFAERQAQAEMNLGKLLEGHTLAELRGIASQRGWRLSGTRKSDIVAQMAQQMASIGDMAKAIYSLDKEYQQVLRSLALHSGVNMRVEDVERTALREGPLQQYSQVGAYAYHLTEVGLAFPSEFAQLTVPPLSGVGVAFVPPVLARNFPPLLETVIPTTWEMANAEADQTIQLADPQAIVRAVQGILLLFEQDPPSLHPPQPRPRLETFHKQLQGWAYDPDQIYRIFALGEGDSKLPLLTVPPPAYALTDETVERLQPLAQNPAHLDFLYHLMTAAALLQSGSPATPWPKGKDTFLQRDPEAQHAALARIYFAMNQWTELWEVERRAPDLRLQRRTSAYYLTPQTILDELTGYRQLILRLLAHLPDNRWVRMEDMLPLLRSVWAEFYTSNAYIYSSYGFSTPAKGWSLTWQGKELDEKNDEHWRQVQGAFFSFLLRGPLRWLGLADLVLNDETVYAFRLHGLADLYWDRVEKLDFSTTSTAAEGESSPPAEEDALEAVSVDKTGRIRVDTAVVTTAGHNLLRRMARVVSSMVGLFVYKMEMDVVYATFEAGLTVEDLVEQWATSLPDPMPRAVRGQLNRWWQAYGQTRIYRNATLIEFGDDYALSEMKAVTSLEKAIVAEFSPRLVLIDRDAVTDLVAQLEKAGYTPKLN